VGTRLLCGYNFQLPRGIDIEGGSTHPRNYLTITHVNNPLNIRKSRNNTTQNVSFNPHINSYVLTYRRSRQPKLGTELTTEIPLVRILIPNEDPQSGA